MIGYGYGVGIKPNVASLNPYDADASAFFTAAGITDTTEKNSINTFVLSLKTNSLWTTFYHLHLLVIGSGAANRKFNLVNPADTDAAFRLSFAGGWTHSTGSGAGSTPNGTTGYADTFLIPSSTVQLDNVGVSIMSGTESASTLTFMYDFGALQGANRFEGAIGYNNTLYGLLNTPGSTAQANTVSLALFTISRTGVVTTTVYRDGTSIGTNANGSSARPSTYSMWLGARNAEGVLNFPANRKYKLFATHTGWNATQASNFNTAVTTLMSNLGV